MAWLAYADHLTLHACLDSTRPPQVLDQAPLATLAAGLDACRPCELLLVDQRLAAALGTAALTRLRQGHPGTRWVWVGSIPATTRDLDALAAMQASGALEWTASGPPLARAMEAMGRGELWLPRHLLQALYESTRHQLQTLSESGFADLMDEALPAPDNLTQREREVMQQLREGLTNKEIAHQLGITVNTVKKHVEHAFAKQGVRRRRQVLGDGEDEPAMAVAS